MKTNEPTSNPNQRTSSPRPIDPLIPRQQLSEVSPPEQESTQGKRLNKWLIIGLVVFALVTLGIAGVFTYQNYQLKKQAERPSPSPEVTPTKTLQPTPTNTISRLSPTPMVDPTASWETYEYLGMEFKYPARWKVEEQKFESGGPPQVWVYPKEGQKAGVIPSYCLRFTQIQNSQASTPEEAWLLEKQDEDWLIKYQYKEILKESKVIVNNLPGFQIVGKSLAPKSNWEKPILIGREIILLNRGMEVRVTYGEWITEDEFKQGNYWPKHGETIDQILSTFKFTN